LEPSTDERAIETVLDAEREAERAIQAATEQATALLAASRERASAIATRGDERIRRLHASCATATDRLIEALRRDHAHRQRQSELSLAEPRRLKGAVDRVAAWLLGEPPGGTEGTAGS
jgi:vacuolar-type H+-ATPase subunit H